MKTLKFKTDIKCSGCIARVTPHLNNEQGISKWSVDILTPEKILTVETENLDAKDVIETVNKAGFKAEEKN
jgi:copper chaperone CopZ